MRSVISLFVAFAVCTLSGLAAAEDYETLSVGGGGGAPFRMRCGQGDYLVGLRARSGDWVDAVAPLCARWEAGRGAFLPPGLGPMQGGGGGGVFEIRCDERSALASLLIERAPNQYANVALLVPACALASDPSRRSARIGPDQFGTSIADRLERESDPGVGTSTAVDYNWAAMPHCNEGDIAVGIFGAAGNYLDRIGLICAPSPGRIFMAPGVLTLPNPGGPVAADPDIAVREIPELRPLSPRRCRSGFVWREASPSDFVCVAPASRDRVRQENATARSRIDPNGAFGPQSCLAGFVWREAFEGDAVCVTPETRTLVARENAMAASRTAP